MDRIKLYDFDRILEQWLRVHPWPTCAGCPSGAFEAQVEQFVTRLGKQLAHSTGRRWARDGMTLLEEQKVGYNRAWPFLVAEGTVAGAYTRQLAAPSHPTMREKEGNLEWLEPEPILIEAPIQEQILAKLAAIEERQVMAAERERNVTKTVIGYVQRSMILAAHYGVAPWNGQVRVLGITFRLTISREPLTPESEARTREHFGIGGSVERPHPTPADQVRAS